MEGFLTVKEVIKKYCDGCSAKAAASTSHTFVKAMFAGMMIGLGASGSSVAAHTIADVGVARLVAGVVFPVGLMMVILLGAELFTGDCLIGIGVPAGTISVKDTVKMLATVFLGNFAGGTLFSLMILLSGQLDYSGGMLGAYTIKVAVGKVNMSPARAVVSGILCNVLVCGAVLMAMAAKDITGKVMTSFFVIMLFVTSGFEHCVANMYYITGGLLAKTNPAYVALAIERYGLSPEKIASLNIGSFLINNLIFVTIGNVIGGLFVLGLPLYYLNREK